MDNKNAALSLAFGQFSLAFDILMKTNYIDSKVYKISYFPIYKSELFQQISVWGLWIKCRIKFDCLTEATARNSFRNQITIVRVRMINEFLYWHQHSSGQQMRLKQDQDQRGFHLAFSDIFYMFYMLPTDDEEPNKLKPKTNSQPIRVQPAVPPSICGLSVASGNKRRMKLHKFQSQTKPNTSFILSLAPPIINMQLNAAVKCCCFPITSHQFHWQTFHLSITATKKKIPFKCKSNQATNGSAAETQPNTSVFK